MYIRLITTIWKFVLVIFFAGATRAIPETTLCGQYENVTDQSNDYSFNTNVWGLDDSGSSCIGIYDNATSLSSTWSWKANDSLVHAYPNVNYNPIQREPIPLSNLSSLDIKLSWSMKPESSTSTQGLDANGLSIVNAKTNVAIDVFLDTDIARAVNTTAPRYEIMVWIGKFGSLLPIGATENENLNNLPKQRIGKNSFVLYQGSNDNGQHVFSWVASSNHTVFDDDISPLIHYLWRNGLILASNYIGVIQMGTEQKHATSNVSFYMGDFSVSAMKGTPKEAAGTLSRKVPLLKIAFALIAITFLV